MAGQFAAIRAASAAYEVAAGMGLPDYLWTHASALWSGELPARLRQTDHDGRSLQAFLLLYATQVQGSLLYAPGMSPLRISQPIGVAADADGPFLALVAVELASDGRAVPTGAFATPIYHARRFLPVRGALDRDVLRALERLQVALDAYGAECTIERVRPQAMAAPSRFVVTLTACGAPIIQVAVTVDPDAPPSQAGVVALADFVVDEKTWRDGRFIRWLERIALERSPDAVHSPAYRRPLII